MRTGRPVKSDTIYKMQIHVNGPGLLRPGLRLQGQADYEAPWPPSQAQGREADFLVQKIENSDDNLKIIQISYRKGAKNGKGYTDKDIMQVASLLYQNKFMGHRGKFNVWCTSLFKAMNIDVPAEIRKSEPEEKIRNLFMFLSR